MTGMMRALRMALGSVVALMATSAPVAAQTVVGASYQGNPTGRQSSALGQSFTITTSGAISQVQIFARSFGAMDSIFELWSGEGKTGSLLASTTWIRNDGLDITGAFTILANPGVYARAGDRFTLFQQVDAGKIGLAWQTTTLIKQGSEFGLDAYQDGSLRDPFSGQSFDHDQQVGTAQQTSIRADALFRVTVDLSVTVVPEPASWALMLAGFATMAGALRVRRRRLVFA